MLIGRRKGPRFRSSPLEFRDSDFEEFSDDRGEAKTQHVYHEDAGDVQGDSLLEEKGVICGVCLDPLLERLVLNERIVRSGW